MNIKLYRAKLHTAGKTPEQIKDFFDGLEPSKEEIQNWIEVYDLVNGIEVVVMKSWAGSGYCIVGWHDDDDENFREFVYMVEQDDVYGNYVNEREEFIKDWDSEEYSSNLSLLFQGEDVEIIEELQKEPQQ